MAGTLLDSFFIALGFDTTGLQNGQKDAKEALDKTGQSATKTQKELEEAAKRTQESYKKVRDSVLEFTAVVVGAVAGKEFLTYITRTDTAVANLSNNIGSTVKQVSTLESVFRVMGSTTADAEGYLRNTNRILEEIKLKGGSDALNPLAAAGLDITQFRDAQTELERMQLLQETTRKLPPQEAQMRLQAAGYSEATITVIMQNRKALADLFAEQEKLNSSSQEDINAAFDRQYVYAQLSETFEGLGRKIATRLSPALTEFSKISQKALEFLGDHADVSTSAVVGLTAAMVGLSAVQMSGLIARVSALTGGLGVAGRAATGLLGIMSKLSVVLGVGAVADAVLTAIDPKDNLGSWVDSNIPGASAVDNFFSKFGLGRSYAEQAGGAVPTPSATPGARGGNTIGRRNNNPGNIRFVGQRGATRGEGGFAAYATEAEGIAAMRDQLLLYAGRGNDTLSGIISTWAPPSQNNTAAYIADVMGKTGWDPTQHNNLRDSNVMRSLLAGITSHEGNPMDLASINAGMALSMSRAGGGTTITTGPVTINTQAKDGDGLARAVGNWGDKFSLASQAQSGVN